MRQAGIAEQPLEGRPALADDDGGDRPLGDDGRETGQVHALVPATGDEDERRVERAQGRDDRIRLRPLRVVDEPDAVDDGDRLEPVLDAGEGRRGLADRVRRDAEQQPDGDRGEGVRDVVGARDRQFTDRHDPAARTGRGDAATGHRESLDAGRDDPAVHHAEAARHRVVALVQHGRRRPECGVAGDDRVLGVEDERAVRVDELGEPALDLAVRLHGPVAIEVVRGDVGVDRHGRARARASAAGVRTAR